MAKQIIQKLIDDLDGEQADVTIKFGLDGKNYEIDLSNENAETFRTIMERFVNAGTRVSWSSKNGSIPVRHVNRSLSDREQNAAIRNWANKNGYEVSERGRIPQHVTEAFHAAGGMSPSAAAAEPASAPAEKLVEAVSASVDEAIKQTRSETAKTATRTRATKAAPAKAAAPKKSTSTRAKAVPAAQFSKG